MSLEIFESVPGGDPQSRRPAWTAERGLAPWDAPDDVQSRRQDSFYLVNRETRAREGGRYAGLQADSLVPTVPADIEARRSKGYLANRGKSDALVIDTPNFHDRQNAYVPLGGLGEDVMLLEAMGENVPSAPENVMNYGDRKAKLRDLADKRRQAICKAGIERDKALDRVFRYDRVLAMLGGQLKATNDKATADDLITRIKKMGALRDIVSGNAVRFSKVQALGQVMLKSATTELNFLILSEIASKRGLANEAAILLAAADKCASNDIHYGDLRKKQIGNWGAQTADAKLRALNALAAQVAQDIARLTGTQVSAALAGEKQRQLENLRVKQEKINNKLEEVKSQVVQSGITQSQASAATNATPVEQKAALSSALMGLEGELGWSISGALNSVGNAVKSAAGAAVDGVKAAAQAGYDLAKAGACALANNPKVLGAITSAAGTAVAPGAGTAAGAAAAGPAASVLKGACPASTAAPLPPTIPPVTFMTMSGQVQGSTAKNIIQVQAAQKKSIALPVAIGVGGAGIIAALLLL